MGQHSNKVFILVRCVTSEVVVEMCDHQVQLKLGPDFLQEPKQRHGIRSARNGHYNAISVIEKTVSLHGSNELLKD